MRTRHSTVSADGSRDPITHEQVIYVDVDDTIIDHHDIPKPHVIKFLKRAKENGNKMYLWSAGGTEYAKGVATKLGIEDCFIGFLPKPDVCLDDLCIESEFIRLWLHPIQLVGEDCDGPSGYFQQNGKPDSECLIR